MKHQNLSLSFTFASLLSLSALVGCGGTTYGTGASQEAQLASDLGGLMLIGSGDKKQPINYAARAKLVNSATPGQLPTPVERIKSDSAYFPTNPEEARARRLAALGGKNADDGSHAYGADTTARDAGYVPTANKQSKKFHNGDHEESAAEMLRISTEGRQARLQRAREARGFGNGAAPRKYLTQPPKEYRTPAETAEAGVVGEYEKSAAEKKKKPLFSSWGS